MTNRKINLLAIISVIVSLQTACSRKIILSKEYCDNIFSMVFFEQDSSYEFHLRYHMLHRISYGKFYFKNESIKLSKGLPFIFNETELSSSELPPNKCIVSIQRDTSIPSESIDYIFVSDNNDSVRLNQLHKNIVNISNNKIRLVALVPSAWDMSGPKRVVDQTIKINSESGRSCEINVAVDWRQMFHYPLEDSILILKRGRILLEKERLVLKSRRCGN